MKLFFKPFEIVARMIATRIGRALFRGFWSRLDVRDPPNPTAPDSTFTKVVTAAALEAATMASVGAAADRAAAEAFHHLTGIWPGKAAKKRK
ncbi:MAG TPA: DUF4235 domain-containing protein [Solirubrobacteraceae bacterium]|jgi:hypothetical protein